MVRHLGFSKSLCLCGSQGAEVLCWLVREEGRRVHLATVTATITPCIASSEHHICQGGTCRMSDGRWSFWLQCLLSQLSGKVWRECFWIKIEMNHSSNCFPFIIIVGWDHRGGLLYFTCENLQMMWKVMQLSAGARPPEDLPASSHAHWGLQSWEAGARRQVCGFGHQAHLSFNLDIAIY